jgi:uncharacterized protein
MTPMTDLHPIEIRELALEVPAAGLAVRATLTTPAGGVPPGPGLLLGHGLANDKDHPLVRRLLERLAGQGVPGLRWNFPFRERGATEMDPPETLDATFDAAIAWAAAAWPDRAIVIGGKSLAARMGAAHQAQHRAAAGLLYLGFPLHAPGALDRLRKRDLLAVTVPQLCLAGDRDPYCDLERLASVVAQIRSPFQIEVVPGGDHGLGVDDATQAAHAEPLLARFAAVVRTWLGTLPR